MLSECPISSALTDLDAEVLLDFVERQPTLRELAQKRGLSLPAFLDWWNSPAIAAALDDMLRIQALRRELKDEELRRELIAILAQVARASTSPVEQRRAATTALRATDPRATGYAAYRSSRPSSRYRRVAGACDPGLTHPGGRTTDPSPSHRTTVSPSHPHRRPRRIADFNLGPEDAERFLERERRENDRLQKLVDRVVAASDALDAPAADQRQAVAQGASPAYAAANGTEPRRGDPTNSPAPARTEPSVGRAEQIVERITASANGPKGDSGSCLGGGFKAEGPPWRSGSAPIDSAPSSRELAAAPVSHSCQLAPIDFDPDPEGTLAIARRVLQAVESDPDAYPPEAIRAAHGYISLATNAPPPPDTS